MSTESLGQLAENKLLLLLIVSKIDIPISNSEICQFVLENEFMDYFTLQQYLAELVDAGALTRFKDNNFVRYNLTETGAELLALFITHVSDNVKNKINIYIHQNSKRIKNEYSVNANYFPEVNDQFVVKCGVYDTDGSSLMEISVLVPTKEQSKLICNNWKKNASNLYASIFSSLSKEQEQTEA
ncbi:MAG: DUF4364 family protein [Lachnospiraceae bacterium]|nr:DUF4364 family protein [Lachnospiraceae bacterium]